MSRVFFGRVGSEAQGERVTMRIPAVYHAARLRIADGERVHPRAQALGERPVLPAVLRNGVPPRPPFPQGRKGVEEVRRLIPPGDISSELERAKLLLQGIPPATRRLLGHEHPPVIDDLIELLPDGRELGDRRRIASLGREVDVGILHDVLEEPLEARRT